MTNAFQTAASGEAQQVDVRAIEKELTQLWKAAGDLSKDHEGQVVMRSCVMNLVVFTSPDDAAQVDQAIQAVTARHPSRSIIVTLEPEAKEAGLEAWISAHCHMPSAGGQQVCCEQITVAARGAAVGDVPGTVVPLLVANIPVTLWWNRDVPFESRLFQDMADESDQIVVDSATWSKFQQDLLRLVDLSEQGGRYGDLNWARLTGWRSQVAQFFDASDKRAYLNKISRVEIGYAGNFAQAMLLASWLASNLGWQYTEGQVAEGAGGEVTLKAGRRTVTVSLKPEGQKTSAEGVQSITIQAGTGEDTGSFRVQRGGDGTGIVANIAMADRPLVEKTSRLNDESDAALLAGELDLQVNDFTLEGAHRQAALWLKAGEGIPA